MNNENLSFATIAITGALGGIGREVTRTLSKLGAHVIAIDLLEQGEGESELRKIAPNKSTYFQSNLTDNQSLRNVIEKMSEGEFPDAVVALAGIVISGDLVTQSDKDIEDVINCNLTSQIKLSREIIHHWQNKSIKFILQKYKVNMLKITNKVSRKNRTKDRQFASCSGFLDSHPQRKSTIEWSIQIHNNRMD